MTTTKRYMPGRAGLDNASRRNEALNWGQACYDLDGGNVVLIHGFKAYIREAIAVEKSGAKVEMKSAEQFDMPEEFLERLDDDPRLAEAFHALTPGRQKGYLLHFGRAKQSVTRAARVAKHAPRILKGLGLDD